MRRIVAFALLFVSLFAGCQKGSPGKGNQEFRLNLGGNPVTLDPAKGRDLNTLSLLRMLFEGLTRVSTDETAELALASKLEISEEGLRYTFTLKKSFWSNGEELSASDFVFAWRRALDPQFPSDNSSQMYVLKNGRAIKEGKLKPELLGVRALNELTLEVELEQPTPCFLELLSFPVFFPLPEKWVLSHPQFAETVKTYVCNGPFSLKTWKHDDFLVLEKNNRYWDAERVRLNAVSFFMVSEETEQALFEKNQLDWAGSPFSTLSVEAIKELEGKGVVKTKAFTGTVFLRVNTNKPGLNDPALRKALGAVIDRKGLVEHVTRGGQIPATTLVPREFGLHAVQIELKGTTTLEEKPELSLLYCQSQRNHLVAQTLQEQWRKQLGLHVKLESAERKVFFDRLSKRDFDLVLADWVADFHDPINFLEILKTKETRTNNTGWENATYKALLDESQTILDPEKRKGVLAHAEKIMLDEMPIIPLYQSALLYVYSPRVKDVHISSMGNMELKVAYIVEE